MIGRNLVHFLVNSATPPARIRVADKRMPFMSFLK
jgi:hypothetical protein